MRLSFSIVQKKCRMGKLCVQKQCSEQQKKDFSTSFYSGIDKCEDYQSTKRKKMTVDVPALQVFRISIIFGVCRISPWFAKEKPYLIGFQGTFLLEEIIQTIRSFQSVVRDLHHCAVDTGFLVHGVNQCYVSAGFHDCIIQSILKSIHANPLKYQPVVNAMSCSVGASYIMKETKCLYGRLL